MLTKSSETRFGNGKNLLIIITLGYGTHTDNLVALLKLDSLYTTGSSAYGTAVCFVEADLHTLPCSNKNILVTVSKAYP